MKFILSLLVLTAVFLNTACPSADKTYRTMREQSAKISTYGAKIVEANIAARKAGEISPELFAELTQLTGKVRDAVAFYREQLAAAKSALDATGKLPAGKINQLQAIFNNSVVAAFTQLFEKLNLVSGNQSQTIQTLIASIRLAIAAVQGAFGEIRTIQGVNNA